MKLTSDFHTYIDTGVAPIFTSIPDQGWQAPKLPPAHSLLQQRSLGYTFAAHYHPYVAQLVDRLIEDSVAGLQGADTEYTTVNGKPRPTLYDAIFTDTQYQPNDVLVAVDSAPVQELDFSSSGAYSVYNWELFYHVPMTIAIHLSRSQRFEEAQRWFHYIFNPTDDSDGPIPKRFWRVRPFQEDEVRLVEQVLVNLATGTDQKLYQDTIDCIHAWAHAPFRPHLVARFRPTAYMFKAVMAYLQNLIDWGDALFLEDTSEAVNEAFQLYVLAANLLGPRPQATPPISTNRPQTYRGLRPQLNEFGSTLTALEAEIPFAIAPHPAPAAPGQPMSALRSLGSSLYFCVPANDKLLGYWDTVADRLFKIRNSLNLAGVFRQLPLFDPPIDPALLARAVAAGLDVAAVLSGVNQPLPLVRYQLLMQKATELCQEVTSLGANLLAAIEKEDNEALALLRARHEHNVLNLAASVKYAQWQEAIKAREAIERSISSASRRYAYYERLLGKSDNEINVPALDAFSQDDLKAMRLQNIPEPDLALRDIAVDIDPGGLGETGGLHISSHELEEMHTLRTAQNWQNAAGLADAVGSGLAAIPDFEGHGEFWGLGVSFKYGGSNLHQAASSVASVARAVAGESSYQAGRTGKISSYARREQEWALQSNTLAGEIMQSFKQLRAAQLREAAAQWEHQNHLTQIALANDIELFLQGEKTVASPTNVDGKHTTKGYYTWLRRETRGLYAQCFQLAFDVAQKAERALQAELGDRSLTFLRYDYQAGLDGLLAGEKLHLDLKRMEMAHLALARREYELSRSASLLQFAPEALMQLRTTGTCTLSLPEELFDLDSPGHYFRRLKSVALSIPCVTGPYTSVPCTLTLNGSKIRTTPALADGADRYSPSDTDDPRFQAYAGSVQSIVTSSGQNDTGLFETNLHDERYLPFEGSGAVSDWQLDLPGRYRPFDYATIADVVLHLRYTAREGGQQLRDASVEHITNSMKTATAVGCTRLLSIRQEFPNEWAMFKSTQTTAQAPFVRLTIALRDEHYPFWSKNQVAAITRVKLYMETTNQSVGVTDDAPPMPQQAKDRIGRDDQVAPLLAGVLTQVAPPQKPTGEYTIYLDDTSMTNLWLLLTWRSDQA